MKIFVSSTYDDLSAYRSAVNEMLIRMKNQISAMEYFGSHGDVASAVCFNEIDKSDILIGIYAWRYGWQRTLSDASITEQEFDYARSRGKNCLCYVVDSAFPWIPAYIDYGEPRTRLDAFKAKINTLVRSTFTTPDNLAKQVAADLVKISSQVPADSFGALLRVNWEVFAPELQLVLAKAYSQARADGKDGVVATKHVIAALAAIPNTGQALVTAFPRVTIPALNPNLHKADVAEMYLYDQPISACVLGSMNRLLPDHSPTQQLLAIELAVDLLKNGKGESVRKFREAGVDGAAISKVESHIRRIANNTAELRRGLKELSDAEIIHLAYVTGLPLESGLNGIHLRNYILNHAQTRGASLYLAGELLRRHPRLVGV